MLKSLERITYPLTTNTNVSWLKHPYKQPHVDLDFPDTMRHFLKKVAKQTLGVKLLVKDENGEIKGPMRLLFGRAAAGKTPYFGLADVAKERREEPDTYYEVDREDSSKSKADVLTMAIIDCLATNDVQTEVPVSIGVAGKNTQKVLDGSDFDMQMFASWYAHCS